jgi:type II secretory pathway predicted ATPase ExeA
MSTYRHRFGLIHDVMPKAAVGKSFFDKSVGYLRLQCSFKALLEDKGVGLLTAEPGVGKTAAIRNLCQALPRPDYRVLYVCNTAVSPLDLYRSLAVEMGLKPSYRSAALWADIKNALTHEVDECGTTVVMVIDEAQHLNDKFLLDLSGFLNFAFDSRDLMVLWLVGLTPLLRRLRMQQHAALLTRISVNVRMEPLERDALCAMVEHGFNAAGVTRKLLSDSAFEMLVRQTHGVPRLCGRLIRTSLRRAHELNQDFIDDTVMQAALDDCLDVVKP